MVKNLNVDKIIDLMENWERLPLALVTMAGPWLTPLVPAYFVALAIHTHLKAPTIVAVIAGIVLEVVGIAGIANATRMYMWNKTKRKIDKDAPLWLSIIAVSVYFTTALILTVVLEVFEELATYAPGMFIVLSISSGLILVLSGLQRKMESEVTEEKLQQKLQRQQRNIYRNELSGTGGYTPPNVSNKTRTKAEQILAERGGEISGAELARQLNVSGSLGRRLKRQLVSDPEQVNGNGRG